MTDLTRIADSMNNVSTAVETALAEARRALGDNSMVVGHLYMAKVEVTNAMEALEFRRARNERTTT